MGEVNENYGGIGDKARWYEAMYNAKNAPGVDQTGRQEDLLAAGLVKRYADSAGTTYDAAMANGSLDDARGIVDNTATNRAAALRSIGGLAGAGRAGLMDRLATSRDSNQNLLNSESHQALVAQNKEARANKLLGIQGNRAARGEMKGIERQQRMAQRMAGPSQEDMIIQRAMMGDPAALRMAEMLAERNITGMQEGMISDRENLQGDREMSIADREAADRQRQFELDRGDSEWAKSPEGQRAQAFSNMDLTGNRRAEDALLGTGGQTAQPHSQAISAIDSAIGEGAAQNLIDAAGNSSESLSGLLMRGASRFTKQDNYLKPAEPLNKMWETVGKLEESGALNDPEVALSVGSMLRQNMDKNYIDILKRYAGGGGYSGNPVLDGIDNAIGVHDRTLKSKAQRLLDLMNPPRQP